jgi:hypothetical protein
MGFVYCCKCLGDPAENRGQRLDHRRRFEHLKPWKARRMFSGVSLSQLCVISFVQVCGIVCAALARMAEGRRWQGLVHRLFLGVMVIVAFTSVLIIWNAPQQWMISATTLTVMVVTATCDFSRPL